MRRGMRNEMRGTCGRGVDREENLKDEVAAFLVI